eukprot:3680435-Rhodomonas_salina.2
MEIVGDVGAEEQLAEPGSEEGISGCLKLPSLPLLSPDTKMPVVPCQREVTAFVLSKWQQHRAAIAHAPRHMLDVIEVQKETVVDCSEKETSESPLQRLPGLTRSLPKGRVPVAGVGKSIVGPAQPACHQPRQDRDQEL